MPGAMGESITMLMELVFIDMHLYIILYVIFFYTIFSQMSIFTLDNNEKVSKYSKTCLKRPLKWTKGPLKWTKRRS